MAHDVFISHSSQDKPVADAACASLESIGIRCWIAPRDVQPGRTFAGEINRAIHGSKVMVLIFSGYSNRSEQVLREVQLASNSHLHIVQFRIQDESPNDDLEYYLSAPHWLDALLPPLEDHLERLKGSVKALLQLDAPEGGVPKQPASTLKAGTGLTTRDLREPPSATLPPLRSSQRRSWMPYFVGAGILAAILLALLLFQISTRSRSGAAAPMLGASPLPTTASPTNSAVARREPSQINAAPSATAGSRHPGKPFTRSWDFTAGMLADIRSKRIELVDAKIWNMPGGKHVRFLTGGVSWMETSFDIPEEARLPTRLSVRHLSSSPDGKNAGYSPVRITLNGVEIFNGTPAHPGWTDEQYDLGRAARPGTNTIRWDFLHGATTHYWLKSFRLD